MELYAAGLNAWNQLRFGCDEADTEPDDLHTFTCVLADDDIRDVRPYLSWTTGQSYCQWAVQPSPTNPPDSPHQNPRPPPSRPPPITIRPPPVSPPPPPQPPSHSPLRPNLHRSHRLHLYAPPPPLPPLSPNLTPPPASPSHPITHHATPLSPGTPWPTPTPTTQLTSHATGHLLLHPPSTVLSTSDPRFSSCLGRPPSPSAGTPHPIPDLLDLPTGPVVKIASSASGYVLAALTAGGDLYAWGHSGRAAAAGLGGLGVTGEVTPVVVEEFDVADVGVGEGHVVVLTTTGEVFGIGSNGSGQLGLGEGVEGVDEWTRLGGDVVSEGKEVVGVVAGERSTFFVVRRRRS